jgi:S-formylglutathione hydrolase
MNFSVFVPPNAKNVPVIYFLSGLECTDQNFAQKATHAFKVRPPESPALNAHVVVVRLAQSAFIRMLFLV